MKFTILNEAFARFIQTRHLARHFRRFAGLDTLLRSGVSKEVPPSLAHVLLDAARADSASLLEQFGSQRNGLSEVQAAAVRDRVGLNEIGHEKPLPWWLHLWHCYNNPFNLLLTLLAAISYYTQDMKAALVISSMVLLSSVLRFVQEARSNQAADRLKEMVSNTATVLRPQPDDVTDADAGAELHGYLPGTSQRAIHPRGMHNDVRRVEVALKYLAPGDVIVLSAGDMIPADARLLSAKDLFVSQAAMTGESLPVEKYAALRTHDADNPLDLENILFMGTNVLSGSATALVIATGRYSYFGALAQRVTRNEREPTAFQAGVNKVSWLLIRFMLVMTPLVFFLNGFTKGNWLEAFLFALSIAVGLTPEMLPMIVTSTLAKGAVLLSRKKVVVKRLDAIQNFGAMDVLCTDKTGTLTQDKIVLAQHTDIWGEASHAVLEYAYLNSYYQSGLKNLLDVAVLEHAQLQRELQVATAYRKVDEIPFDFQRRRMSVVLAHAAPQEAPGATQHLLICKGAVEEMLAVCTHVRHGALDEALNPALLANIHGVTAALNAQGLRVVAVAAREFAAEKQVYAQADEAELTLLGYIAFLDPPKESTAPALQALQAHGVSVKILTGDNALVTAKICREVGLAAQGLVLGAEIDRLDAAQLAAVVEHNNVFAKLSPAHKERIVAALRKNGHVVGFMGDGINDAPALRAADIGISVDSAVDIAKEAADIILLEKSLMVLEEGVLEGRRTFANMLKYIKMTASSNFGNVFSVLIASVFLPFLPMLPMQLLVQNLLYDISQIAIPFDHVDAEMLSQPQSWNPADIGRFMAFFGPLSSLFDITTFGLMWHVFGASDVTQQALFQSGWFVEGLLSQTLIVHMIRTRKIPFLDSRAAWPLLGMTAIVMGLGIFLVMGPLAHYFKFSALPHSYFPLLLLILLSYAALTQAVKGFYARRYGWQ